MPKKGDFYTYQFMEDKEDAFIFEVWMVVSDMSNGDTILSRISYWIDRTVAIWFI